MYDINQNQDDAAALSTRLLVRVDRVLEIVPRQKGGSKNVTVNENFF